MQCEFSHGVVQTDRDGTSIPAVRLRLIAAVVAGPCWAMLSLAILLSPRTVGYGTHEQMGIPACSFLARTGYPCPTCGLTTSVSDMVRGRIKAAFFAHPFGVVLVAAVFSLAATSTAQLITARPVIGILRPGLWWVWVAGVGLLAGWAGKIALGLAGGQLPLH